MAVLRLIFCSLILGFVTACSWFYVEPDQVLSDSGRSELATIEHWKLDGRVAVNAPEDSWQAGLEWERSSLSDELLFTGPLGQGAMQLVVSDDGHGVLTEGDGTETRIDNLADSLGTTLHFDVPLSALKYWVLGVAQPGAAYSIAYDESGKVAVLSQLGWDIQFQSFMVVDKFVLPRKLSVEKEDFKLKLVVSEWMLFQDDRSETPEKIEVDQAEQDSWWMLW